MRRKWEKGDFVYFSSHNFLLELSALCGSKKPQVFELGTQRAGSVSARSWGERVTTENTGHTEEREEGKELERVIR
jgi:hypothetical protein